MKESSTASNFSINESLEYPTNRPSISNSSLGFTDSPEISHLITDPDSFHYLEEFLADIQDVDLSQWYLLWLSIAKWKGLEVTRY